MKPITVIGSVKMDLVCRVEHIVRPGETLLGEDFVSIPGGKGANQAVAAAKLAQKPRRVRLIARVGDDDFGQRLLNGLQQHNVDTEHVIVTEGTPSGCALILVDMKGENSIVVVPGANARLTTADIDAAEEIIAASSVVVMQLEIPFKIVQHAIALCQRVGVPTILDPAPVPTEGLPRAMFGVDIFTPNQHEAELLIDQPLSGRLSRKKAVDAKQIGGELLSRGPKHVVLKLGDKGAMLLDRHGAIEAIRGFKVSVVDTTAAGDAFTGALAVAIAEELPMREAVRFANAAGAIACKTFGAQPALPDRPAVDKLLR